MLFGQHKTLEIFNVCIETVGNSTIVIHRKNGIEYVHKNTGFLHKHSKILFSHQSAMKTGITTVIMADPDQTNIFFTSVVL